MVKVLSVTSLAMAVLSFLTFCISIGINIYYARHDIQPNKTMGEIIRFHLCPCMFFVSAYLMFLKC